MILILRQAVTLAQEAEVKLKKYESLSDDDSLVMQIHSVSQSESMIRANQGQMHRLQNKVKLQIHLH